tara:strand:+ start:50275 stop:51528 length:1254 start_codon:yes stop_codon:yes gene_type:complete
MLKHNPFVSSTFKATWRRHFSKEKKEVVFPSIPKLSFIKYPKLPLYRNVGGKNTKGISYSIAKGQKHPLNGSVLLCYDIHSHFQGPLPILEKPLKLKRIEQYPGFLCALEGYNTVHDYMQKNLSKKSKYRFNLYQRKLEHSFAIRYAVYSGEITKAQYDFLFDTFYLLLRKRFDDKKETNNNLHPDEWNFYYELTFPMILEKKAALFVTYDQEKPIAISLLFFADNVAIDIMRVFDIDYSSFRLGMTSIIKQLEWCIAQHFKFFDFSKGDYEYKNRWATKSYTFEYHLLYDSSSLKASLLAKGISFYFTAKQYLRDLELHTRFHQLTHRMKKRDLRTKNQRKIQFQAVPSTFEPDNYAEIPLASLEAIDLKKTLFDFLNQKSEKLSDLQLFQSPTEANGYIIKGKKNMARFIIPKDK